MKEKLLKLPDVLRRQVILHLGVSLVGLILLVAAGVFGNDWRFCVPCIVVAVLFYANGLTLLDRGERGSYIAIEGVCTEVEKVGLRKRTKSICIQADQQNIRILNPRLGNRKITPGSMIKLYLAENAPVYDLDGYKVVNSHLALQVENL